jgi:gamma-glutamylcyclotransferase (GGCT)/AIG2-like uncharacterized protein YtfP
MHGNVHTFLLFVYGTLKRGGCRHGPLASQHFRGETHTRSGYALHDLGDYPGLVVDPASTQAVQGEVYEVEESLLPWLDTVEGSPGWFRRDPIEVEGFTETVWAYFYQGDAAGARRIASGCWDNPPCGEAT